MIPAMGPEKYRYSRDHLWVSRIGRIARVGVTDFAQAELGEILFVDLPDVDDELARQETFAEVESTRTTSELVMPVSGTVVAVNEDLEDAPTAINEDPYGRGWLVEVELDDPSELDELMDAEAYDTLTAPEEQGDADNR
jgi:glycine cleavage system H protein